MSAGSREPARLPRCFTPLTYGSALVIKNLLMGLSVVSCGHEKALREEGPERPIGRLMPARQRSAPSCRRGRRIRARAGRIEVAMASILCVMSASSMAKASSRRGHVWAEEAVAAGDHVIVLQSVLQEHFMTAMSVRLKPETEARLRAYCAR